MAADRGAYICQSQSLNLFVDSPSASKLTSMHFYAWKKGLKTGMYYLRTQAATQAVQFTVEKQGSEEMQPVIPHTEAATGTATAAPATSAPAAGNDLDSIETTFTDGAVCTMQEGCITCSS